MSDSDDKARRGTPEAPEVIKGSHQKNYSFGNERELNENQREPKVDTTERARLVPIPPPKKGKE
jgi:hypothetical protein